MPVAEQPEEIPLATLVDEAPPDRPASPPGEAASRPPVPPARLEAAAKLLERAAAGANPDPTVLTMLAMAYKRLGKGVEARAALRKIARPDAGVLLQMGLLSLADGNLTQAEAELTRARQADPDSFPVCYNLLLTTLTLGKLAECLDLAPLAIELACRAAPDGLPASSTAAEVRFLEVLRALLVRTARKENTSVPDPLLSNLTGPEENNLLGLLRGLGHLETLHTLLRTLADARPRSAAVREAYHAAVLVKGKELIDRCNWTEAELLLRPLLKERNTARNLQAALLNLLGCCACLTQDFGGAVRHFQAAAKLAANDPRLQQNLALTFELQGDLDSADPHWNRYFDLLGDGQPAPADIPRYREALAYESLTRLASRYADKEKWLIAVNYMQRACLVRPGDAEALERLFGLFVHAKKTAEAKRTLDQLRRLRPREPQYDLYELDLIEVKGLNDVERMLNEISRIRGNYPGDARVDERATGMVGNVIPIMVNLCDQLTDQMTKVIDQVRHLPNFQINWPAVREVMRDLLREFQKLRRIAGKCLQLVTGDEQRRTVRELAEHIDKKMEACRSMGA